MDNEVLLSTRVSFLVQFIEAAGFYFNDPTKSTAFHVLSFYLLGRLLLQKLYDLYDEFNETFYATVVAFVN